MLGFGWCHLRSSREPIREASVANIDEIDALIDKADGILWKNYRMWMAENASPFIQWQLVETLNNNQGLLTYCLSRNHRSSCVWGMLEWIKLNGPGSYGLFHCHDDEDCMDRDAYGRNPPVDFDNVFRIHRLLNGELTELDDPFFGLIQGDLEPIDPFNRPTLD